MRNIIDGRVRLAYNKVNNGKPCGVCGSTLRYLSGPCVKCMQKRQQKIKNPTMSEESTSRRRQIEEHLSKKQSEYDYL